MHSGSTHSADEKREQVGITVVRTGWPKMHTRPRYTTCIFPGANRRQTSFGATRPITLHIEYQAKSKSNILRLIISVYHPEHFFYNWKLKYSIKMDMAP